jgi:hypothetical protein
VAPFLLGTSGASCGRERGAGDFARSQDGEEGSAAGTRRRRGPHPASLAGSLVASGRDVRARSAEATKGAGKPAFVGVGRGGSPGTSPGLKARVRVRAPRRCL